MANKKLAFEDALERIEEIVMKLENEEVPLEQSIALYKEGLKMAAFCQDKLVTAEGEIVLLMETVEGQWQETPFLTKEE